MRVKIADRDGVKSQFFSIFFGRMLEDNRTLADYNIQKDCTIEVGFLYKLNFEGNIIN